MTEREDLDEEIETLRTILEGAAAARLEGLNLLEALVLELEQVQRVPSAALQAARRHLGRGEPLAVAPTEPAPPEPSPEPTANASEVASKFKPRPLDPTTARLLVRYVALLENATRQDVIQGWRLSSIAAAARVEVRFRGPTFDVSAPTLAELLPKLGPEIQRFAFEVKGDQS